MNQSCNSTCEKLFKGEMITNRVLESKNILLVTRVHNLLIGAKHVYL